MRTNKLIRILKNSWALLFIALLLSCNSNYKENLEIENSDVTESYESVALSDGEPTETVAEKKAMPKDLKIIKSASAKYKVKNVKDATKKINMIVQHFNGYVSAQRFQNDRYQIENRFTIKVPSQSFASVMDTIVHVAEFVDYENISTQDITEEYVDLQSRLKTKVEVKQRYESILRKRAKTVEDILATEEKLRIIQEEIETVQGRLKYLTNKVTYSTIQVELYETVDYKEEPESYTRTFVSKTKEGFSFGWKLIENIIIGIIHIWPLILLAAALFFVFRKNFRK